MLEEHEDEGHTAEHPHVCLWSHLVHQVRIAHLRGPVHESGLFLKFFHEIVELVFVNVLKIKVVLVDAPEITQLYTVEFVKQQVLYFNVEVIISLGLHEQYAFVNAFQDFNYFKFVELLLLDFAAGNQVEKCPVRAKLHKDVNGEFVFVVRDDFAVVIGYEEVVGSPEKSFRKLSSFISRL